MTSEWPKDLTTTLTMEEMTLVLLTAIIRKLHVTDQEIIAATQQIVVLKVRGTKEPTA